MSDLFSHWRAHQLFPPPPCGQSSKDLILDHLELMPVLERSEPPSASPINILQEGFFLVSVTTWHTATALGTESSCASQGRATTIPHRSPPGLTTASSPPSQPEDRTDHITACSNPSVKSYNQWIESTLRLWSAHSRHSTCLRLEGVPGSPCPQHLCFLTFMYLCGCTRS